jgi:hypothetical protein
MFSDVLEKHVASIYLEDGYSTFRRNVDKQLLTQRHIPEGSNLADIKG